MFELLRQLPLFQGVSSATLMALIEKYPFHFMKFAAGSSVASLGEQCAYVRFVVSGAVRVTATCRHLQVTLAHTLCAPHVMGVASLFGPDTAYPFTAQALDNCGILQIAKADYVAMLQSDKVLLFNILNYLSRGSQHLSTLMLDGRREGAGERFAHWVGALTSRTSRDVVVNAKRSDMCVLLGVERKALQADLETLAQDGILDHEPRKIIIHDLRALITHYKAD